MGCVSTISYNNFPKQGDISAPVYSRLLGKRVKVCYHYDTSKFHYGTIVRYDREEPFETIIALDNGRYIRAVECMFSPLKDDEEELG